ncbi:MAG: substrate-binding domain-containing protein [Oscillospiraceae bacterium]
MKKIAVIMPEIFSALDYEFLYGIYEQAKEKDCDILVFTGIKNAQNNLYNMEYIQGLKNIYELVKSASLDGIIFAAERFHDKQVVEEIEEFIRMANCPYVSIGRNNEQFQPEFSEQRNAVKLITKHLIDEHDCRKLYFISGIKDEYYSEERKKGFQDALAESGIEFSESDVFYGYFWKDTPYKIGADIAEGIIPKPDAVVCASDIMAVALCDSLIERGISVPEDIKITGYDGHHCVATHIPSITTVVGNEEYNGRCAFSEIYRMITDEEAQIPNNTCKIRKGWSCGCGTSPPDKNDKLFLYINNIIEHIVEQGVYMGTDVIERMINVSNMKQLVDSIDNLCYLIRNWKYLSICLCEDWKFNFSNPNIYRCKGFSDRMINILTNCFGNANMNKNTYFRLSELLPLFNEPHEPMIFVFTSLHLKNQIFGYISTAYTSVYDIHLFEHYINWCDEISNGLRVLQEKMYYDYIKEQIETISVIDPVTNFYNKRGFLEKFPYYLYDCRRAGKLCIIIFIAALKENNAVNYSDSFLTLANAIKNSSDSSEYCVRLGDDIFAVVMQHECKNNNDIAAAVEQRIVNIHNKLKFMNNLSDIMKIEFITDYTIFENDEISDIGNIVEDFILNIKQKSKSYNHFDNYEQLNQLRKNIYTEPQLDWNIDEIHKMLGLSRSHMQRLYKAQFSVSCTDDIINARIQKAKKLLENTNLSVQDISFQCGYNDESHFMRQFKKRTGFTASQFRKNHK